MEIDEPLIQSTHQLHNWQRPASRRFLHISKYKIQFSNKTDAILKGFKRTMCHKSWSCQLDGQKNTVTKYKLDSLNLKVIFPEKHHGLQHINPHRSK
jgi:hypothetical protein